MMISHLSRTKYHVKSIFFVLLFLISTSYSRSLKPISINTSWRYYVQDSYSVYGGKFLEKIVVHDTDSFVVDFYSLGINEQSLASLRGSGIRLNSTRPAKIFILKDSIFLQSLDTRLPCPGTTPPPPPPTPAINVLYGYIIQTDSLRIQVINDYITYIIPVTYDSAQFLYFASINYFQKDPNATRLFTYRREKDRNPNIIEFTGRITTSGSEPAAIDSNGIRHACISDYSDVRPCESSGMCIQLDTNKLLVRYSSRKYKPSLITSNSNFTNILLNGRVFSTTDINSSRIELSKSGIRTVKLP